MIQTTGSAGLKKDFTDLTDDRTSLIRWGTNWRGKKIVKCCISEVKKQIYLFCGVVFLSKQKNVTGKSLAQRQKLD